MAHYDNPNALLDTWSATGNDLESFAEILKEITSATSFEKTKSTRITVNSHWKSDVSREKVFSFNLDPSSLPGDNPALPIDSHLASRSFSRIATKELLEEWGKRVKLSFRVANEKGEKKFYLASGNALMTMDRFGITGSCLSVPSLERDMLVARLFEADKGVTLVSRKVGETFKIFSILSDQYLPLDQKVFFDIIKEIEDVGGLGKPKCHSWEVSNFFTKLYIEFPEKAEELSALYGLKTEMIPGLMLSTSDTGDASFSVRGTWRISGHSSVIISGEIKRKHAGKIDVKDIVSSASDEIFAEYSKLPEALCKLATEDVTNPLWNLGSEVGIIANSAHISSVIKSVFKQLGIVKAIGKKTEKVLYNALIDEFDYSLPFTAYDLCMSIMTLPERVTTETKRDLLALQKACAHAPFAEYKPEKSAIIITA